MTEVLDYLKNKLKKNDTIVIGASSGPDSMCLLSLLLLLKEKLNLKIICAHINHNIRDISGEEAEFVKEYAKSNNCIFEYLKIEEYKDGNFEANAREKRYQFYNQLINKYNASYLMTAHHGDDLIETIIMRIARGSNLKGYIGFKKETNYKSYQLIRPLINITKKEIEEYNQKNNIKYYIDVTNNDETYTRNYYRHNLLPVLKEKDKNIHQKFLKFSENIIEIESFLENETKNALTKVLAFDKVNLHEFNKLAPLLKKRVIEYLLEKEYQDNINLISNKHLDSILVLCQSKKANQSLCMPMKKTIVKSYEQLYFLNKENKKQDKIKLNDIHKLNEQGTIIKLDKCDIKKSNYIIRLNSQEIKLPLYIRYRKQGDVMTIKNMEGQKKIKDIFINEKIPMNKRDSWPIIVDSNDTIIWLPGLKKSKFDKNIDEFYDIIYKYVVSEENL